MDLFAAAARYIGTPHVHGAASPWGMDCVGLVAAALRDIGVRDVVVPVYSTERPLDRLLAEIDAQRFLRRMPPHTLPRRNDICAFSVMGHGHMSIADGSGRMIHSTIRGGVQIATMGQHWTRRMVAVYELATEDVNG